MPDYLGTQAQAGLPSRNKYNVTNTAWGHQRVKQESTQLFLDTFDSSLDTTNKWTASNGGGGVLPAYSTASATLNSGTTANGFSLLKTIPSWAPREPGFLEFAARINIESPVSSNGYRFWGFANAAGTPTLTNPITDGVGFELINGLLYAVTYAANARNYFADLSAITGNGSQPANANAHKYYIWFRGDLTIWAIDDIDNIVAVFTAGASGPNVNTLPVTFLDVAGAGSTATTIVINGVSVGDSGRNNVVLADGTYPFRTQKILQGGDILVNNAQAVYPSAPTNVASSASDVAIAAANTSRRMLIVSNDSTAKLYLLVDVSGSGAASSSNFTYVVPAGGTFEFPNPVSTARIRGIWASANGSAGVTDISNTTALGGS